MDSKNGNIRIPIWFKIVFWLLIFIFFVYSFRSILMLESTNWSSRTQHFVRMMKALSHPRLDDNDANRIVATGILETFQMAFLATTISTLVAIPVTCLISHPSTGWKKAINIILQPLLAAIRAIHPLIIVIPVIVFSGINARSGVIALSIFTTAILVGIFYDYAFQHTSLSMSRLARVHFPALAIRYLPSCMLIASVIGFFGGGGIGFYLQQTINLLDYPSASTAIIACIITIGGLDLIGRATWRRIYRSEITKTPNPRST